MTSIGTTKERRTTTTNIFSKSQKLSDKSFMKFSKMKIKVGCMYLLKYPNLKGVDHFGSPIFSRLLKENFRTCKNTQNKKNPLRKLKVMGFVLPFL
jgi:hypothetical protein